MRLSFAAALLALAACSAAGSALPGDPAEEAESSAPEAFDRYRLSGPYARANLAVYLFHRKDAPAGDLGCVTLEEAFRSGSVRVSEKADGAQVNELQIENSGDRPVYLQAGDTVKGGQQDRTIAVDGILPPRSGKRTIDAFCVEPGRWSAREARSGVLTGATFTLSEAPVATTEQRLAVRLEKRQEKVWEAGKQVNEELARKTSSIGTLVQAKDSYVQAVEAPAVTRHVDDAVAALRRIAGEPSDAVGAVFCVNGKVQNAEVYATAGLFRKLWPRLLRAAAVEELAKRGEGEPPGPPSESDLRALLAEVTGRKGRVEVRPGGPTVRVFERESAVLFDTESEGKLLHRQVLTK